MMIIILLQEVWMYILRKLRKQLQKDPNVTINNIHGEGFRLIVK
jgi:hypothetical protein